VRAARRDSAARGIRLGDDSDEGAGQASQELRRGPVAVGDDQASVAPAEDPAFPQRFRELERDVFRVCRRLLDSNSAADDAVNEVYLRARRALGSYDEARPFRPWLLSIAGNHCIDQLRRRRVETRIFDARADAEVDGPADPGPSPLAQTLRAEDRAELLAAIDELPSHFRIPLVLRYWSDMEYTQIAEVLGVPRGQVGSLLFRARRQLRASLSPGDSQ
jgi:RNA polymerase sigma factor (sigma-70 family)